MRATQTHVSPKWSNFVDRAFGYAGLSIIGAMAWACDRVGYRGPAAASRPPVHARAGEVAH